MIGMVIVQIPFKEFWLIIGVDVMVIKRTPPYASIHDGDDLE